MPRKQAIFLAIFLSLSLTAAAQGPRRVALGDWPEMRGPNRDGVSKETGLINSWAVNGENFLWRAPYGGRSAPVVLGNRVYVQNPAGRGTELQERVMALDADTGRVVWEYKWNNFQSDAPAHRVAWSSPAVDPETGNVYAFSSAAQMIALDKDGKYLWDRSYGEEYAAFTTHGGRTVSPTIDGDLVIINSPVANWGGNANRTFRLIAMDKRTGEIVYVSNPGGRPYDTAYPQPLIATIDGVRQLITGLGDGGVYSIEPQTGRKIWGFVAAKRAINTAVAVAGNSVFISHGDENLDTVELGMVAALDGSKIGEIKEPKWANKGTEFGFSSPVTDGTTLYQIDGGSHLFAYDAQTGRELWSLSLSLLQKAPPVLADGKIYVGTDNGEFFIVRVGRDKGEILSKVELPESTNSCCGSEGTPEQILAGAAVSRGRIFFVSSDAVYAIGPRQAKSLTGWAVDEPAVKGQGDPAHLQVVPAEVVLEPGQKVNLRARLFDDHGRFLREESATWSLDKLKGTFSGNTFTVASDPIDQGGLIKASAAGLTGESRVRVVRPLPWEEDFESYAEEAVPTGWVNAVGARFRVATLDGQKSLYKPPDNTILKRARVFVGPTNWSNYTFEADVRSGMRRRQMGDIGITSQRYSLVLYGNTQKLKIEPWEPEIQRTVTVPFSWKEDTWYRLKVRSENLPDGKVRVQGKAWPVGEPEPAAWTIEKVDPIGNREGAPGIFLDAQFGIYLDNFHLYANQ